MTLFLSAFQQLSAKTEKKKKKRNCNLYWPCWVSKTLVQKPAAFPVHRKIPNETKKRLVAQKQAIGEDYCTDLFSLKAELDLNESAIVEAKFSNHSLGVFRNGMTERKKNKTPLLDGALIFN